MDETERDKIAGKLHDAYSQRAYESPITWDRADQITRRDWRLLADVAIATIRPSTDDTAEPKAMLAIAEAMAPLSPQARNRVIRWALSALVDPKANSMEQRDE